jgi:hypothetical protein
VSPFLKATISFLILSTVVGTTHSEEVGDYPSFAYPPDSVHARTSDWLAPMAFENVPAIRTR